MNNMEIKVGDKVRVREDAPSMFRSGFNHVYTAYISKVLEVDDGNAIIEMTMANMRCQERIIIPTKYLIKVDAEAKEAKYKVGNWVMISGVFNPQLNGMIGWISRIDKDGNKVSFQDGRFAIVEDKYLTLITQPTEQTEEEKTKTTHSGNLVFPIAFDLNKALNNCDCFTSVRELIRMKQRDMEENNKPRYVPKIMFNTEFWVKYEADLAKEVALKVANKFNNPEQAAEYATDIAQAVVEGLKRK